MDKRLLRILCGVFIFLVVFIPTDGNIVPCGTCECNSETNLLVSCAMKDEEDKCFNCFMIPSSLLVACPDRIVIENAIIKGFESSFSITERPGNDVKSIGVELGDSLTMDSLKILSSQLKKQQYTVHHLSVSKDANIPWDEVISFYNIFQKEINELCIDGKNLRYPEDDESPKDLVLTSGSRQNFKSLVIANTDNKVHVKADDDLFVELNSDSKIILPTSSSSREIDIYLQKSLEESSPLIQLDATCSDGASPSLPRLIQLDPNNLEDWNKTAIHVKVQFNKCTNPFLPASFLDYVDKFDKLELSDLPNQIDWGALGTEQFKMRQIWIENRKKKINSTMTDKWSQFDCGSLAKDGLCELCYMQHFGLHKDTDKLDENCSAEGNSVKPNLEKRKCLRDCPKEALKYPQNTPKPPNYNDYVVCGNGLNLTKYCNYSDTGDLNIGFSATGETSSLNQSEWEGGFSEGGRKTAFYEEVFWWGLIVIIVVLVLLLVAALVLWLSLRFKK